MEHVLTDAMHTDLLERIRALSTPLKTEATDYQCQNTLKAPIRAVILDVYGTLLISESGDVGVTLPQDIGNYIEESFSALGIEAEPDVGEHAAKVYRNAIKDTHGLARKHGTEQPEVEIREIWQNVCESLINLNLIDQLPTNDDVLRLAVEYECRANPAWPAENAVTALKSLQDCGLRLGLVSNAQFYTPLYIEALLGATIEQLGFDKKLCAWSYLVGEAKPSTVMYEQVSEALKRKGILTRESLFVGNDMLNDIAAASKAGFQTMIFAGDRKSLRLREGDRRCSGVRPNACISTLPELAVTLSSM